MRKIQTLLLGFVLLAAYGSAQAAAPSASGLAYDFKVNVSFATVPILDVSPRNQVQFTDQASAYENSQSTLSYDSGSSLSARLQTGALDAETQWIPGSGFLAVGSRATANDVDLGVVNITSDSLLSLQAALVQATAIITGTCPVASSMRPADAVHVVDDYIFRNGFDVPNLEATSKVIVRGAEPSDSITLSVDGTDILSIPTDPEANTTVSTGIGGVSLILNERTLTGDGIADLSVATNAFHLNISIVGVITADVVISHAQASITCN